jgi:hypothetical protein
MANHGTYDSGFLAEVNPQFVSETVLPIQWVTVAPLDFVSASFRSWARVDRVSLGTIRQLTERCASMMALVGATGFACEALREAPLRR